jgi:hypothetical protein
MGTTEPQLDPQDLVIDTFTNSGPNCWVRVRHKPTGIFVEAGGTSASNLRQQLLADLSVMVEAVRGMKE